MTKEEKKKQKDREYQKKWYEKNKDRIAIKNRKNKKLKSAYNKKYALEKKQAGIVRKPYWESVKDGYYRVYLLEDYNYVGVTNCIQARFINHKSEFGRDCSNHRILYKTKDRSEALELEELLHDLGYEGKHAYNSYK